MTQELTTGLNDKVIALWLVVHDGDLGCCYLFTSIDKVRASVLGSLQIEADPHISSVTASNLLTNQISKDLDEIWTNKHINVCLNSTSITVLRIEIDRHNPVGRILLECADRLTGIDNELVAKISALFSESN